MIDPSLPLQAAIVSALKSATAAADRVFDRTPTNTAGQVAAALYPFLSLGPMTTFDASNTCHAVTEVAVQIDAWSRAVGYPEVKTMAAAAAVVLDAALAVVGFAVLVHEVETIRYQREPDGLTSRAILSLRFELTPTA